MSRKIASAQSAPWARPSKSEATSRMPTAIAVLTASPSTEWRRSSSSGLASMKRAMWATRKTPIARAKVRPRLPKASGTQSETISIAAIAAKMTSRTAPSSGSMTLVSQA